MTDPRTALLVDDTPETRRLMRRVLERDHWRILEAESGEQALRLLATEVPSVVVLDLRLPVMSGFDVARAIRAHPVEAVRHVAVLACSASIQADIRDAALAAGCDAFEGKPFDVMAFPGVLRQLAEHRGGG